MYCMNCGEELKYNAIFCPKCGNKVEGTQAQNMEGNTQEIIIMKGICNRVKNPFMVQNGHAILTNKRFIYLKHSLAKTFVIGALVNFTKGSYDFDIPVQEIAAIEDGRQGISKTIIIKTRSGETYNFYFTKREEWKIHLQNAKIRR